MTQSAKKTTFFPSPLIVGWKFSQRVVVVTCWIAFEAASPEEEKRRIEKREAIRERSRFIRGATCFFLKIGGRDEGPASPPQAARSAPRGDRRYRFLGPPAASFQASCRDALARSSPTLQRSATY